jgi:MFS family permease
VGSALAARVPPRWAVRAVLGGIVVTGIATALTAPLAWNAALSALVLVFSGVAAGAIQVLGQATAAESVHPEERGDAIAVTGTFRAAALFAGPLAVAGLVLVVPLAPAVALVGAAMTVPAVGLRHRIRLPAPE